MYVYPDVVTRQQCSIYRFDTTKIRDLQILIILQDIAQEQSHRFKDIYPWRSDLINRPYIVYVALSFLHLSENKNSPASLPSVKLNVNIQEPIPANKLTSSFLRDNTPIICGWMNSMQLPNNIYLSDITTRTPFRKSYAGIGYAMFNVLLEYSKKTNKNYIELYALSDSVAEIYRKWGFINIDATKKMYYRINSLPEPDKPTAIDDNVRGKDIFKKLIDVSSPKISKKMKQYQNQDFYEQLEVLYDEFASTSSRSTSTSSVNMRIIHKLSKIIPDIL